MSSSATKKDLTFQPSRCIIITHLPVAQLDSASDSDSEGRRFESCWAGQKNTDGDKVPIGVLLSFPPRIRTSCCCKATAIICALPSNITLAQIMRANTGSESVRL